MSELEKWAERLNGRAYDDIINDVEQEELKEAGLIVCVGALNNGYQCNIFGVVRSEIYGRFEGGCGDVANFTSAGKCSPIRFPSADIQDKKHVLKLLGSYTTQWLYNIDVPNKIFVIRQHGIQYWGGIIFSVKDLQLDIDDVFEKEKWLKYFTDNEEDFKLAVNAYKRIIAERSVNEINKESDYQELFDILEKNDNDDIF